MVSRKLNFRNRQNELIDIWRKIRPRKLPLAPRQVDSPLTKSYLRRVQRALEKSHPLLEGLPFRQFQALVRHEFFDRLHIFPSHGPSFMLPGQRLSSELQREWNRARDWKQHAEKLVSLRDVWTQNPDSAFLGSNLARSVAILEGLPREKVRSLLSHPDFQAEHDFPAGQFGTIRSSVRDRILREIGRSRGGDRW